MDIANPTSRGSQPRPPLKWIGGCWADGGSTGVDRKMAQRFVKVPRCPAMMKCASIVQSTLNVQIRENSRVAFFLGVIGAWVSVGESSTMGLARLSSALIAL